MCLVPEKYMYHPCQNYMAKPKANQHNYFSVLAILLLLVIFFKHHSSSRKYKTIISTQSRYSNFKNRNQAINPGAT